MINKPSIDKLIDKVGNNYMLCTIISKRARQISDQINFTGEKKEEKPITLASMELMNGQLKSGFEG